MKVCLWFAVIHAASLPLNTLFATGRSWTVGRGVILGWIVFPAATLLLMPSVGGVIAVALGSLAGRTVRTLAATLPTPAYGIGAVYNSQQKRIYLLGGYSGSVLNTINVFDPQSETIAPASISLSHPNYQMAAIYSPLSDRIYTFGGLSPSPVATDAIYSLNFTSALNGAVTQLPAHLPQADFTQNAVHDSHTGLIYLIGGQITDQVTENARQFHARKPRFLRCDLPAKIVFHFFSRAFSIGLQLDKKITGVRLGNKKPEL